MPHFLVESYLAAGSRSSLAADAARLRAAAARVGRVRLVRSIYVPADEVCFHVLESDTAERVEDASRAAQLDFARVQSVVELGEA